MKLRGILIDPTAKSITEVETESYPHWKTLIEVDMITAVTITRDRNGEGETLWIDDEGLINEKRNGPFFSVSSHPQPLAGKGIIFRTDAEGETVSTQMTVEQAEAIIAWRPNVKFDGMKPITPHMEKHPVFGDVHVMGHTAQFSPIDEEDRHGD